MIYLIFITIAAIFYFLQKDKINRREKREIFKIKQQGKFDELLKKAREEDRQKK